MRARAVALSLAVVTFTGCRSEPEGPVAATPALEPLGSADLDATLEEARAKHQPVLVVVTEVGQRPSEARLSARIDDAGVRDRIHDDTVVRETATRFAIVDLDLHVSRSRALAARYHLKATPLLVALSPRGVVVRRDEGDTTRESLLAHLDDALERGPAVDARLVALEAKVAAAPDDVDARLAVAGFLIGQESWREAIPHLEVVAHDARAEAAVRVHAWVDLARAHYWCGESEKGLHTARALIAELGPSDPEAIAGGNLVIARRHMETNRPDLARTELDRAIAAAPESVYGKQAREERDKLSR